MSLRGQMKRAIKKSGKAATLHSRTEWTGEPTLEAAGSGGSIPAGTYSYAAVLTVDGVDYWGGERGRVTCVDNDKVTVSGITVPSGYTCKLYRSTDPKFPTPALLSSNAEFPYEDTADTPSAGTFDTEVEEPYVFFTDSAVYALELGQVRETQRAYSGGKTVEADMKFAVAYDVSVAELDELSYSSTRYQIAYLPPPTVYRGVSVLQLLFAKRMI